MKFCIDILAAQTAMGRNRGIGNYAMGLAKAVTEMLDNRGDQVYLFQSHRHTEGCAEVDAQFKGRIPAHRLKVGFVPSCPTYAIGMNNAEAALQSAAIEWSYGRINPDVLLISSLFDPEINFPRPGAAKISAVVLYDLIPLIYAERYLTDESVRAWYHEKLMLLEKFDLIFAISESARQDVILRLGIPAEKVVNILGACDARYTPAEVPSARRLELMAKYGLVRPYLMFTGGGDWRKNLEGAIRAYALVPKGVRAEHCFAIVCSLDDTEVKRLLTMAKSCGLGADEVVLTKFVPDDDLLGLYRCAKAFVFPSFYEGFGLPPLEAMSCGIPSIAARNSSLVEVVAHPEALFDAADSSEIASMMQRVLTDEVYRETLREHGLRRASEFTWENSARKVIEACDDALLRREREARYLPVEHSSPTWRQGHRFAPPPTSPFPLNLVLMPASPCPVFVISLVRSVDRREHVTRTLAEVGVEFEFIDAVDGAVLPADIGALYDDAKARASRDDRPLTRGEIGCALSHVSVWRKMIREDIPVALIMEDDFGLNEKKLDQLLSSVIPHLTGTDVVLLTNQNEYLREFGSRPAMGPYRLKYVTMTTWYSGAYLVTREAAVVLEKAFTPVAFPADAWTGWPGLRGLVRLRGLAPHPVEHTADFASTIDQIEQRSSGNEPVPRYTHLGLKIRRIHYKYFAVPAYYLPLSFVRRLLLFLR